MRVSRRVNQEILPMTSARATQGLLYWSAKSPLLVPLWNKWDWLTMKALFSCAV